MDRPLISVVLPVRNAAEEVTDCLLALSRQTFRGFEVCVVDGASTDGTPDRVSRFRDGHDLPLTLVSAPDAGVYDAMNKGIALTRGEWLYFMGADDLPYDSQVFADVAAVLSMTSADFVHGDVVLKGDGRRLGGKMTLDVLLFEKNVCHQAVFYRRVLIERVGGYSLRYPIWSDWDMNLRCFKTPGVGVEWMDRVIALYNDLGGVSAGEDPIFRRELPVTLLRDSQHALLEIRSPRSYRLGKRLFGWLD